MPDSSADRAVTLEKVKPQHICGLLEIIQRSTVREISFIASRYAETATDFEDTLGFLKDLGWLRSIGGQVSPANEAVARIVDSTDTQRSLILAEALFGAPGPYERPFASYLSQFERCDGELVHRPTIDARLRQTGVRDFLMELGAVTHRIDGDDYLLAEPFAAWALWARNVVSPTANQLRLYANGREQIGRAAELAAFAWERRRVGEKWQNLVRHISGENPAACFDIQSVTVLGSQVEQRFIEVKAISADSFEFHWSAGEIEAAEILHARYFLYLVPVKGTGAFDLELMEIIQDPYSEVYHNPTKWATSVTNTICRKRQDLVS
jgi:hypothetical protein